MIIVSHDRRVVILFLFKGLPVLPSLSDINVPNRSKRGPLDSEWTLGVTTPNLRFMKSTGFVFCGPGGTEEGGVESSRVIIGV